MDIGFVYAIGAAVTWGLVYAVDEKILSSVSAPALLLVNSAVSLLIVLPILLYDPVAVKALLASGKSNLLLILGSAILAALANLFIFLAIKYLDANTASIIEIAYPFFVIFFSYLIFRTTPNIYFFLGGALIFIGTLIIVKFA